MDPFELSPQSVVSRSNQSFFHYLSMSRHYYVMGDPRTCTRCDSRCALFGQRDPETAWSGWCVLCNTMWRNRRIESVLMSVSRDFALRSLATLLGNNAAASVTLSFLQTIVGCVKYNILLRHHLNLCVLLWLCCPLEWWHESDSEAEEERIRRPVLRTLHETAILHVHLKHCASHAPYQIDPGHCCTLCVLISEGLKQPTPVISNLRRTRR